MPPKRDSFFKRKKDQVESDSESDASANESVQSNQSLEETPAQKRLRLAREYLKKVKEEETDILPGEIDAKEIDRDLIAERLSRETLEKSGRAFYQIGDALPKPSIRLFAKGHQQVITSVACKQTPKGVLLYSAAKDATIFQWDFHTGKYIHKIDGGLKKTKRLIRTVGKKNLECVGHSDNILALDISSCGSFMATGGLDKQIIIWDATSHEKLHTFSHHRQPVTALRIASLTNMSLAQTDKTNSAVTLYSASQDRTVKVFNLSQLSYIETLFGHQDVVTCLSIPPANAERCITSGNRDHTVRLWKIPEESQLVFRAGGKVYDDLVVMPEASQTQLKRLEMEKKGHLSGFIDTCAYITDSLFLSGGEGGISLWTLERKKPLFTRLRCHGPGAPFETTDTEVEHEPTEVDSISWVTCVAPLENSDIFASAGGDGYIRFWRISDSKKSFNFLYAIPVAGFVNSMCFVEVDTEVKGKKVISLVLGVGREYRLGRWWSLKEAHGEKVKNRVVVFDFNLDKRDFLQN